MTISRTVYHPSDDFLPWVGSSYGESPFKLLVLGESHHHEGDRFPEDKWILFTRGTIEDYLVRSKRWFAGFTRTMAAVAGSDYWLLDRQKFWSDVSFYNFVPGAPVDTPGVSPSQEWFNLGRERHLRLLKELNPMRCLCSGTVSEGISNASIPNVETKSFRHRTALLCCELAERRTSFQSIRPGLTHGHGAPSSRPSWRRSRRKVSSFRADRAG